MHIPCAVDFTCLAYETLVTHCRTNSETAKEMEKKCCCALLYMPTGLVAFAYICSFCIRADKSTRHTGMKKKNRSSSQFNASLCSLSSCGSLQWQSYLKNSKFNSFTESHYLFRICDDFWNMKVIYYGVFHELTFCRTQFFPQFATSLSFALSNLIGLIFRECSVNRTSNHFTPYSRRVSYTQFNYGHDKVKYDKYRITYHHGYVLLFCRSIMPKSGSIENAQFGM